MFHLNSFCMQTATSKSQVVGNGILKAGMQKQDKIYFLKCYLSFSNSPLCAMAGMEFIPQYKIVSWE